MNQQTEFAATGRRKEAVAHVVLKPGNGKFTINGREAADFLARATLLQLASEPLAVTDMAGKVDLACSANGGGVAGQAGAIRLALSRALAEFNPEFRSVLRREQLLTRDPRAVERKKYGQPKARKRFQYSKR
ncbi:MAG: 30S ribosomal protein S9 [candidate division Zixibacteria bacterium]|jgi:small subunit ribosomal protein S9|nr:30S ribosomal protein S9 [candidate division Zixibacteria bacterium]